MVLEICHSLSECRRMIGLRMTINESTMLDETIKDKLRSIYQAMDKVSLPEKGDGVGEHV